MKYACNVYIPEVANVVMVDSWPVDIILVFTLTYYCELFVAVLSWLATMPVQVHVYHVYQHEHIILSKK